MTHDTVAAELKRTRREDCRSLRELHQVQIGESWGTLPVEGRHRWAHLDCDDELIPAKLARGRMVSAWTESESSQTVVTKGTSAVEGTVMPLAEEMENVQTVVGPTQAAEARSSIEIAVTQLQPPPELRGNAGSEQESARVVSAIGANCVPTQAVCAVLPMMMMGLSWSNTRRERE